MKPVNLMSGTMAWLASLVLLPCAAVAQPADGRFNDYILKAVEATYKKYSGLGYDLNKAFTHNLTYGPHCCVKASGPPKTMCVAAVSEVIIEALSIYRQETSDEKPFADLPLEHWTKGTKRHLRSYIFMYDEVKSNGTAHALERFGIGKQTSFKDLQPGDFINLNRSNKTGHAVVFLGFLNKGGDILPEYSADVAGFKYYSAQRTGTDGLGFKWGYFEGYCPPKNAKNDCRIMKSDNPVYLNAGYMLHPKAWQVQSALAALRADEVAAKFEETFSRSFTEQDRKSLESDPQARQFVERLVDELMSQELPMPDFQRFDGVTPTTE